MELPDFKGYLSDLGGPSANMYHMRGNDEALCKKCKRPSCIHPKVCPNLNSSHRPLLDIYHAVDALPGIKKSFIGSGVRYDLLLHRSKDPETNKSTAEYTRELIARHVSGRLKVAPEHTSERVLSIMRKPSFSLFQEFKRYSTASIAKKDCGNSSSLTSSPAIPAAGKKIWQNWPSLPNVLTSNWNRYKTLPLPQ